MALPPEYRRIGKRSKLPPYGTAPGMVYNRYHRGHRAVSGPTGHLGNPVGQPDYLMFHPDSYAPHPGHISQSEPQYESYEPSLPHLPTPMLRAPQPWIPAPDEITYQDAPMTDELTQRAMEEIYPIDDARDVLPFDHEIMANDVMVAPNLGLSDADNPTFASSTAYEIPSLDADWNDELASHPADDFVSLQGAGPDSLEAALGTESGEFLQGHPMLLEYLVDGAFAPDELSPSIEPPRPEIEDDPLLFDAWMMPGMGLQGFGPFGAGL